VVTIHGAGDVRIDEVAAPVPTEDDVVVDIKACGICGSDLKYIRMGGVPQLGRQTTRLGHEAAGEISFVGANVRDFTVGQRVVVNPQNLLPGVIGCGGSEGMLGHQVLVPSPTAGWSLIPVPDDVPWDIAALAEPLAVALHGVNRADPAPDEKVVVFGAGPIGIGVVIWLVERGVTDIVVVEPAAERLAHAVAAGARVGVDPVGQDLRAALEAAHGVVDAFTGTAVGTQVYIDAAGAPSILSDVMDVARKHARMIVIASPQEAVPFNVSRMLTSEMTLTTSMGYPTELPDVVAALPRIRDKVAPMISHRLAFDAALDAFDIAGTAAATKVLVELGS
jgi:threonine dehydrogenase-like Zn-dependent dehydrogenase